MHVLAKDTGHVLVHGLSHKEFQCQCNYESCRHTLVTIKLLHAYWSFRNSVKSPLKVTSGYRCPQHNFDNSGHPQSKHLFGSAIDIAYTPALVQKFSVTDMHNLARQAGFEHIIHYEDKHFFHFDVGLVEG